MSKAPFFSVIIPAYNRAHLISKAIASVLAQTFEEWELIIVDDGSTDNTKEVVRSFADARIIYLYQENAERCAARNNGIKKAKGVYICFLDSDDYYLPLRLALLHQQLKVTDFPVAAFYTELVVEKNGMFINREERKNEGSPFDHLALSVIHSQQTCIHHRILEKFQYDIRFHIGEDMELWLRMADSYPLIFLPNQQTVVVLDHDDRSVNVQQFNMYKDQLRMLNHVFSEEHAGHQVSEKIKKQLISAAYFGMAKFFIYKSKSIMALKNLVFAILKDPANMQTKYRLNILLRLLLSSKKAKQLL